jgi:hypothetical protein
VVVLAVASAAAAFVLLDRDDGDAGGTGPGGASPEQVTGSFVEAARTQACETMVDLVSGDSWAGAGASRAEQLSACRQVQIVPYEFAVTGVELVDQTDTTATVTVTADVPGGTDAETLELVHEDSGWKIDLGPAQASATVEAPPLTGGG